MYIMQRVSRAYRHFSLLHYGSRADEPYRFGVYPFTLSAEFTLHSTVDPQHECGQILDSKERATRRYGDVGVNGSQARPGGRNGAYAAVRISEKNSISAPILPVDQEREPLAAERMERVRDCDLYVPGIAIGRNP